MDEDQSSQEASVSGRRVYEDPPRLDLENARTMLATSDDVREICEALIGASLYGDDFDGTQDEAIRHAAHPIPEVRMIAATALGHLARRFGHLDSDVFVPVFRSLLADQSTTGYAKTALDDIAMFCTGRAADAARMLNVSGESN